VSDDFLKEPPGHVPGYEILQAQLAVAAWVWSSLARQTGAGPGGSRSSSSTWRLPPNPGREGGPSSGREAELMARGLASQLSRPVLRFRHCG